MYIYIWNDETCGLYHREEGKHEDLIGFHLLSIKFASKKESYSQLICRFLRCRWWSTARLRCKIATDITGGFHKHPETVGALCTCLGPWPAGVPAPECQCILVAAGNCPRPSNTSKGSYQISQYFFWVRWGDGGLSSEVALNGLSNVYTYNVALGTAEEKVLAYAHWLQLEGRVWIQCSQGLRKVALLVAKASIFYIYIYTWIYVNMYIYIWIYIYIIYIYIIWPVPCSYVMSC